MRQVDSWCIRKKWNWSQLAGLSIFHSFLPHHAQVEFEVASLASLHYMPSTFFSISPHPGRIWGWPSCISCGLASHTEFILFLPPHSKLTSPVANHPGFFGWTLSVSANSIFENATCFIWASSFHLSSMLLAEPYGAPLAEHKQRTVVPPEQHAVSWAI